MRTRLCMLLVFVFLLVAAFVLGREGSGLSTMESGTEGPVFVVDPGHGGEDGGAVSADGLRESELNLAVCLRMDDLFGLFWSTSNPPRRAHSLPRKASGE